MTHVDRVAELVAQLGLRLVLRIFAGVFWLIAVLCGILVPIALFVLALTVRDPGLASPWEAIGVVLGIVVLGAISLGLARLLTGLARPPADPSRDYGTR